MKRIVSKVIRANAAGARRLSPWLSIRNEEDTSKPVELLIYDQIGKDWWDNSGVDAKTFAETLAGIASDREIIVAINSPGGNVWDGLAIYNRLQTRKNYVTTRVDGIAASIASIIALAGKDTQIPKNALMMIHDPSGLVVGTADDMRQLAEELDKHADVLADIYATKAGGTAKEWRKKMRAETWFNGTEAKDEGLADTILDEVALTARFDLSRCRNVPAALQRSNQTPPASRPPVNPPPEDRMKRKQLLALFASLSVIVAADAADDVLLAELQKLHAAGKVTAEQFKELTGKEPDAIAPAAPTPAPAPVPAPAPAAAPQANAGAPSAVAATPVAVSREEFQGIQAQLRRERDRRLTGEFNALAAENPAIRREAWLPRLLATTDDAQADALLADLRTLPAPFAGIEPIRPTIAVLGNPLLDRYNAMGAGPERAAYRLQNFQAIQRVRREFAPRSVNTFDAALVTDALADGAITTFNNRLAPLAGFSHDFSVDPLKPGAKVQVQKVTGTDAVQVNPTDFEVGDTTIEAVEVTVAQISKSFHITQAQANLGWRLESLSLKNAHTFVNKISDLWTALLLVANGYADETIGASAAFDSGVLAEIYGWAKNFPEKNLVLDGSYKGQIVARINPFAFKPAPGGETTGTFGFDSLSEQNRWTGADAGTVGIVAAPDGIAVASGLPIENLPRSDFNEVRVVTMEPLGLSVVIHVWGSLKSRTLWSSYDVMFGAAVGDAAQLVILKA